MIVIPQQDVTGLAVIFGCLVFSAFFSMAETAITSIGVLKARHLLERRGRGYKNLRLWLKHPARVLTTILMFNNAVNILAGAVATDLATRYFQDQAIGIASGVTTFLVLIFGEITPKSFARAHSEKLALLSLPIINILYRLTYPLVWSLSEFTNFVIKKLGTEGPLKPHITEDELEFLINEGEKAGVIEDTKKEMISNVFEFDETKVREIMTPRTDVIAVEKEDDLERAIAVVNESGHSRIPIFDERIDNIIGVLFAKDLLRPEIVKNLAKVPLTKLMRSPIFVPESKPLMEVFKDLKRTKNHMAIVIDEYGGTAGLVTMEDILEEIVGDIQDEYDTEEAKIVELQKGTFDVSGSVNIGEFMEYFHLDESFEEEVEGEVDTIGGWMTQLLGDLPEVGQTLIHEPLTMEVTAVNRHRIERLRVVKMSPPKLESL